VTTQDDEHPRTPLGAFIRQQRAMHELSLRQLAYLAGISNPYLSQIEHGLREPSEKVLQAIAESLELSADALQAYTQRGQRAAQTNGGDEPAVVSAIKADAALTPRQRQAMREIYAAFTRSE
jgi:transcriptional regulator with XRE-family HTH domain